MTTYADTPRDRNIKDITAGEILLYGSADGGTTWYPVKTDALGRLSVDINNVGPVVTTEDINFSTAIDSTVIAAVGASKIYLCGMDLTVGGETNLTIKFGSTAKTGAMDFGGTGEPKGMARNYAPPIQIPTNTAFVITSSLAVQVSGWVQYYVVAD